MSDLKTTNLSFKALRLKNEEAEDQVRKYLEQADEIAAVTVCFSDLEGRFHTLDYDKDFFLKSSDNLTFDGSSIRGFSDQNDSDLLLKVEWESIRIIPWEIDNQQIVNKALTFASVCNRDGSVYPSDFRARLKELLQELYIQNGWTVNVAAEIEGFLFKEKDAEKKYCDTRTFDFVNSGGYFDTLPCDSLRTFIDQAAKTQRIAGFQNEKDHPEVAPSQFELNWSYTEALIAADQIQLYKLICRRIARNMGYTACFLPKPVQDVNGNGMHTNFSIADKNGKNLFYGEEDYNLSSLAHDFINGLLHHATECCLIWNSSVNSYRRLDPAYEAPNQIMVSSVDRGSMIRVPFGTEKSARLELRSVSPDANPYLLVYSILKAGLSKVKNNPVEAYLPTNIYNAMINFRSSKWIGEMLGQETKEKYLTRKHDSAERCPMALGTRVKTSEIMFHHEVTNQYLWTKF